MSRKVMSIVNMVLAGAILMVIVQVLANKGPWPVVNIVIASVFAYNGWLLKERP